MTSAARGGRNFNVTFGGAGTTTAIGYIEKFREMNVTLVRGGRGRLGGRVGVRVRRGRHRQADRVEDAHAPQRRHERPEAVRHDHVRPAGRLGARRRSAAATGCYYVRFRVTAGTAAQGPELKTVFGRDYVERTAARSRA